MLTTGDESTVCAYDPQQKKLTLVCLNDADRPGSTGVRSFSLLQRSPVASRWITEPRAKARYQPLE